MKPHVLALLGWSLALPFTALAGEGSAAAPARDPFNFVSQASAGLSMVIINGKEKSAVINGKMFHVGDAVDDSRIISITIDYVDLLSTKRKWRMYVK